MERIINGIQQVGIGVADASVAFEWYKKHLGFDTVLFEDVAEAALMHPYTGGKVYERYAVLAMNMQGGGGLEIWQYTGRTPLGPSAPVQIGDLGIFAVKIKCRDVVQLHTHFTRGKEVKVISEVATDPFGNRHFFIADPFGNHFQLIEQDHWFQQKTGFTGGVCGAIIGVSDLGAAVEFYQRALDYDAVSDKAALGSDLPGGHPKGRRALLTSRPQFRGAFSRLLGPTTVELVEAGSGRGKIFEGRFWGDLGFIHVCYDLTSMQSHERLCKELGCPLTVNSGDSFDMGQAAGQFAYNEDPDGTLIEYVETHKVPLFKKLGLYLRLHHRRKTKPLPDWMIKCLGFSKKSLQLAQRHKKQLPVPRSQETVLEPVSTS